MDTLFVITAELPKNFQNRIIVKIPIENPVSKNRVMARCLVDTGCVGCGIQKSFAKKLGLSPSGTSISVTPYFTGEKPSYMVNIAFNAAANIRDISASEFDNKDCIDFIIGMKVLRYGDMALTNANGHTVFSFRIPPADKHIDFRNM